VENQEAFSLTTLEIYLSCTDSGDAAAIRLVVFSQCVPRKLSSRTLNPLSVFEEEALSLTS
jgi:hypothetical protein